MSIERRVMWQEGAFLRQQHFQQQDRRAQSAMTERISAVQPFFWGFSQLEIDAKALAHGAITITRCAGAFQDGECFGWPGEIAAPLSLMPERPCNDKTVYLRIPEARLGARLAAAKGSRDAAAARYVIVHDQIEDALRPGDSGEPIEMGLLNAHLALEKKDGFLHIPVARIREITSDNRVMLDEDFIPTVTRAAASASLIRILRSIADKLASRADVLANEKAQVRAAGNAALIELMLLRIANAKGAVFAEMAAAGAHHPEAIYRECLALAGELVTFSSAKSTRAPRFDPYDHDNIAMCFAKALACIDDMLAEVVDPDAYKIPLNEWEGYGFHGVVTPPHLLPDGRFIIVAKAALDEETFRKTFVRQTTIASSAQIPDYVAAMDRGLQLRALSSVPSELRAQAGWTYFELGHDQPCWADIVASQAIAIYFAEVFPDLKLELWGIRSGK